MTFHEAMNRAFYIRQEDGKTRKPLESCEAYGKATAALIEIFRGIGDKKAAEAAADAIRDLVDLEANYFYRVGLQDGISLTAADFPTHGIA